MEQNLQQTIALLTRTPAALNALLRGLPDEWTLRTEGDRTWTAFDVVGHLAYCERVDWMSRARLILSAKGSEEIPAFRPVDREGQRRESEGKSLDQLLDDFSRLRRENLAGLQSLELSPADFSLQGRHPAFGPVTLSQLLATWTTHDLTHLHQLSRILAHQYRDAVGPWKTYLGVLQCDGHSSPA